MSDADAAGARIEEAKMTKQDFAELLAYLRAESSQYPKNILQIKGSEAAALVDEIERLRAENERLHEQLRLATVDQAIAEAEAMSDDFQRGFQARLAHLIGEASQWSRGSGAHPPGLVKALNEAFEYGCAEIERLQRRVAEMEHAARIHAETIKEMQRAHAEEIRAMREEIRDAVADPLAD